MRSTVLFGLLLVGFLAAAPACSSSDSSTAAADPAKPNDPGAGGPGTPAADGGSSASDGASTPDPVTCASHTWCGSGSITQYNGQTLPSQRGGQIADGLYREAYVLAENGTGTTFGGYGSAYLFRGNGVRAMGGLASVGTYAVDAGKLTITGTTYCNDETGEASNPVKNPGAAQDYYVDAQGRLFLFSESTGSNGKQTLVHVYEPQTSLCTNLPTAVPATPGDSFVCKATNCGCTEATNGPADAQVCKFVHGG